MRIITAWFAAFSNLKGNQNTIILYDVFYFYNNMVNVTGYSGVTVGGN